MSTICAIATASGGAIGIVRVSGENAIQITDNIYRSKRPLVSAQANTVHFGTIQDDDTVIDEVLVSVFHAPHSYTGEDCVEIACHGSSYILHKVMDLLVKNGCTLAQPGEYTQRAFMNGKMDLSQAEAVADLIASNSESSHRVAMTQMRGGITHKLAMLREKLLHMTSLLELELDFSEENVEFADRTELVKLSEEIRAEIDRLLSSFSDGNALKNGIPVAIIGLPNVGKSTLLNQLLHDERAIVSEIQGTTRDVIEECFTIKGITFRFIDTAGIRHTNDTIEQKGIERALKAARDASIILLMKTPDTEYPDVNFAPHQHVIRIENKTEHFQALTGIGLDWLETELVSYAPQINKNEVLLTNLRHKEALEKAEESITRCITGLRHGLTSDLVSEDLRQCLSHLSQILGAEITTPEVLKKIFRSFCIGK